MGPDYPSLLRGLGKFVAVVIASVVVGAVLLGIGLSKLTGGEDSSSPPLASAPATPPATTGATATTGAKDAEDGRGATGAQDAKQGRGAKDGKGETGRTDAKSKRGATGESGRTGRDGAEPQAPRIRVLSSTFVAATTPSGRKRRRARLAVRLRVTARGEKATLGTARLISGDDELTTDPNATEVAGKLLDPIPAGMRATGELRFETSGALTDRLADKLRATLRIGDRTLSLRLAKP